MTLQELIIEYLKYKKPRVSDNWYQRMVINFSHFRLIEHFDITSITSSDIEACFTTKYKITLPAGYNYHISLIRALLNYAVLNDLLLKNVAKRISFVPINTKRKRIPGDDEVQLLIDCCRYPFKEYLIVMKNTLARSKELNNLKWEDVDFDRNTITLRTEKTGGRGQREDILPLNSEAREALWNIHEIGFYETGWFSPGKRPRLEGDFVFGITAPWKKKQKKLTGACKRAKIPRITFHYFRHYAASKLNSLGVPIRTIQYLLRHRKLATTELYLQSFDKDIVDATNMLMANNKEL